MALTLQQSNVLISWSIVIGLLLVTVGLITNKLQGGRWLDFPFNYTTAGYLIYFSGWVVFLSACAIAEIFGPQ